MHTIRCNIDVDSTIDSLSVEDLRGLMKKISARLNRLREDRALFPPLPDEDAIKYIKRMKDKYGKSLVYWRNVYNT